MSETKAVWLEGLKKWSRPDGKECYGCQNSYSTSPELFEVEYENGEKLIFCSICIDEGPFQNEPEEINVIRRVK